MVSSAGRHLHRGKFHTMSPKVRTSAQKGTTPVRCPPPSSPTGCYTTAETAPDGAPTDTNWYAYYLLGKGGSGSRRIRRIRALRAVCCYPSTRGNCGHILGPST